MAIIDHHYDPNAKPKNLRIVTIENGFIIFEGDGYSNQGIELRKWAALNPEQLADIVKKILG